MPVLAFSTVIGVGTPANATLRSPGACVTSCSEKNTKSLLFETNALPWIAPNGEVVPVELKEKNTPRAVDENELPLAGARKSLRKFDSDKPDRLTVTPTKSPPTMSPNSGRLNTPALSPVPRVLPVPG